MELMLVFVGSTTHSFTKLVTKSIVLRHPSDPQMQHLYRVIKWTIPHLAVPHKYIIYWRLKRDVFLPIFDYMSLKAALGMMVERKIYVVEKSGNNWCKDLHPMCALKGRPSDVVLLSRLTEKHERRREDLGYSVGESVNMRHVLNILKGVPKAKDIVTEVASKLSSKESKKGKGNDKGGKKSRK